MEQKKVVYISGSIKGVEKYWEAFEQAEEDLAGLGYIPLSPARLPGGMTLAQYMRINFAMIDSADAVLFLADWDRSEGACLEYQYCEYIGKPRVPQRTREWNGSEHPREVTLAWLKHDLEEVLKV